MSTATQSIRASCTAQATIDSPLGPLLLARTASGLAGVWFEGQKDHPGALDAPVRPRDVLLAHVAQQLRRYFSGRSAKFDVPLDLHGTPFQKAVWQSLLGIASGTTRSYGDIARELGAPNAARAVGGAVGKNPVSVLVPCHRVVGSSGALTGYAGGVPRKIALLKLEGALA